MSKEPCWNCDDLVGLAPLSESNQCRVCGKRHGSSVNSPVDEKMRATRDAIEELLEAHELALNVGSTAVAFIADDIERLARKLCSLHALAAGRERTVRAYERSDEDEED